MAAPLIGLTIYPPDAENKLYARVEYVDAIRRAGGIPLLIPPGDPRAVEILDHLDGLLLCGGGDIDPALYGGRKHETVSNVSPERDQSEIAMARRVVADRIPTLGICRGAQVLNVALGGTLHEHVPEVMGEKIAHRTADSQPKPTRHPVTVDRDSKLAQVLGTTALEPSSWHHQAVKRPADGLRVAAHAPDGTIEAVEMPDHPWLIAVQFHCELRAAVDPTEQRVFDDFVRAAARRRDARGKA